MGTSEIHESCDPEIVSRTQRTCVNGNSDTGNAACAPESLMQNLTAWRWIDTLLQLK